MTDAVAPITSQDISAACSVPVVAELKDRTLGPKFGVGFHPPASAEDRASLIEMLAKSLAHNFEAASYDGMTAPIVGSSIVSVRFVVKA